MAVARTSRGVHEDGFVRLAVVSYPVQLATGTGWHQDMALGVVADIEFEPCWKNHSSGISSMLAALHPSSIVG